MNKCNNCGKPAVKSLCELCKLKQRQEYIQRRKDEICVSCGKNSTGGKSLCPVCAERQNTPEKKNKQSNLYRELKAAGLCVSRCGKMAQHGSVQCWTCRLGHRLSSIDISKSEKEKVKHAALNFNGQCPICKEVSFDRADWNIDHCHEMKLFRGIICLQCNLLLGFARSSTEILRAGIQYLETFQNAYKN